MEMNEIDYLNYLVGLAESNDLDIEFQDTKRTTLSYSSNVELPNGITLTQGISELQNKLRNKEVKFENFFYFLLNGN